MKLLVKGGQVIDPANNRDDMLDILVEDGKITKMTWPQSHGLQQPEGSPPCAVCPTPTRYSTIWR